MYQDQDPCPVCENDPCTCESDYIYHAPTTGDTDDDYDS
jgi:hypothetical protein